MAFEVNEKCSECPATERPLLTTAAALLVAFLLRTDAILGLLLPHVLNEFPLLIHLAVAAPLKRVRLEADGESAQLLPIPQRRNEQK